MIATFAEFFRLAKHHKIPEQKNTPICTPHMHTCMYPHTHTGMNRDIRVRIRIQNTGERILGTQTYAYVSTTYAYAHALSVRQSSKPIRRQSAPPIMNFLVPFVNPFLVFVVFFLINLIRKEWEEFLSSHHGWLVAESVGKMWSFWFFLCSCCIHLQVSASSSSSILVLWCFFLLSTPEA